MPWSIIAIPVIFCLVWGFKNGLKTKANARFKRPAKY